MNEKEERIYVQGTKQAYTNVLMECLRYLAIDEPAAKTLAWIAERQAVIGILRDLCEEFGSNDWEDDLHLGDVIEKHLAKYLWDR